MKEQDTLLSPGEFAELREKLTGCRRYAEALSRSDDEDVRAAAVLAVEKFDAALEVLEKSIFVPRATVPELN